MSSGPTSLRKRTLRGARSSETACTTCDRPWTTLPTSSSVCPEEHPTSTRNSRSHQPSVPSAVHLLAPAFVARHIRGNRDGDEGGLGSRTALQQNGPESWSRPSPRPQQLRQTPGAGGHYHRDGIPCHLLVERPAHSAAAPLDGVHPSPAQTR